MLPIYEISAAPHFPYPLRSALSAAAADSATFATQGANDNDIIEFGGEILVAITAS